MTQPTHSRLLGIATGRPNGPKLAELVADLDDLRENTTNLANALDELAQAAEDYVENATSSDERADAWELAQECAQQAADSYGAILLAHADETAAR